MNIFLLTAVVSFFYVGIKSVQQLNVSNKLYWFIVPFSIIMALLEIFVVGTIVTSGSAKVLELALALGVGGGFGSICATYLHAKVLEK